MLPPPFQFVNVTIALLFVVNSPMVPMYHYAIARDEDRIIEQYRNTTGLASLGIDWVSGRIAE